MVFVSAAFASNVSERLPLLRGGPQFDNVIAARVPSSAVNKKRATNLTPEHER